ncbi:MAG: alanine--tRNA ligase [Vicinamibacteraceae bacterium]
MTSAGMTGAGIRRSFLEYFESQGHRIAPSSSLVPIEDPTLLFTNAGMNQFKDLFLGREKRDYKRATTSQKCMRVSGKHNDLDNVGPSHRHHTFFEMLGNFSFGDYFKEDAIRFAWTVLTDVWGLPKDRLRASIFAGDATTPRDDDAFAIWKGILGDASRIDEFGAADNFWQMGETGPCGRCSEIFYDRRGMDHVPADDQLIEVWNNVFMEFNRLDGGVLEPLPARSIDTGMGLERITAVIQGKTSNYDTDLFQPILSAIGDLAGVRYAGGDTPAEVSMRVVADHLRATTFLISDGVIPSNEWRGYVLRKIMRRAMRHGKRLGLREPFLHQLVDVVVGEFGGAYTDLAGSKAAVVNVVKGEEERFDAVLTAGLPRLEELLDRAAASKERTLAGEDVFRLYDSLGVPVDFIEDLASERQLSLDRAGYERAMDGQRERARAGSTFDQKKAAGFTFTSDATRAALEQTPDRFVGYDTTAVDDASVVAIFDAGRAQVEALTAGATGFAVTDRTPFYLEAGGQVSDSGTVEGAAGQATIDGVVRVVPGGPRAHRISIVSGQIATGSTVRLAVDAARRDAIRRNHTATHLLHAALREVLGPHVKQAGSLVAPDRLRFDFVQPSAIPAEAIARVERIVNDRVLENTAVTTEIKPTADAMAAGAMALFGEKYGDTVRVVSVPGFSLELCGGTHVRATGDIGLFAITAESGVAAGVRRVEAVTGTGAYEQFSTQQRGYTELLHALGADAAQAKAAVERLQSDVKRLTRELQDAKVKAAMGGGTGTASGGDDRIALNGAALIARRADGLDRAGLRTLADSLKDKLGSGVVVLASEADGKVSLVVSVTKDLIGKVQAGQVVKQIAPIVGGGGGGRPDFAEAGGKDPGRIADLLRESRVVVERMLGTAGG